MCIVGAVLFSPGLWNRDLWHPLEPRYAQAAHEMVANNNWLTLTLNGAPYYNKPPVFFWLEAVCIKAFGLQTASVRLPSLLLGIGGLVLCYLIARRLGINPLISSLVLATSWAYVTTCQRTTIDITLSFLILLAFHFYLLSTEAGRRGWVYFVAAMLVAGVSVLTKGPVALLVLGCALLPHLVWQRKWREVFHWKWLAGFLLIACVGLPWILLIARREGGEFINIMIGREVVSRLGAGWTRPKSFFLYFLGFPRGFMPWFFYFPLAVVAACKRRDEQAFRVFLWFATAFAVFTLIPAKSNRYIIPLYPAAAMVVGAYLSRKVTWAWKNLGFKALVAATAAACLVWSVTYPPHRNKVKSPKPLAMFLKAQGAAQDDVVWLDPCEQGVSYYAGYSQVRSEPELSSLEQYPGAWIIASTNNVPKLLEKLEPVRRFRIGRKQYLVFKLE